MGRSNTGINLPLNQRKGGGPADKTSEAARPCWVELGSGAPLPGTVHAWRRDPTTGRWHALVVVWLPAQSVGPRDP